VTIQPVSGGDINCAYRVSGNGQLVFMKANREKNIDFFVAEVAGLRAIAVTRTIRVPEVLAIGRDDKYGAFLLLEWSRGTPSAEFFENFGHRLAEMHKAETGGIVKGFGFSMDNFIGAGKQENTPKENWTEFFRDHRLAPQLRKADYWFDSTDRKRSTRLLDNLGDYLPEPDFPSLLHGDLWSGNYITGNDGEAWLIDPAVYVGHAEADLAMTELFGGFPGRFYEAYNEVNRIDTGYKDRRDLYNLYHLLNHLNLFGGWYLGEVKDIIRRYS
jgi:fructosamine-3-kinase